MRNWNSMSLMLLKSIAKLYVAFGGGTRKIQMRYRSVGQKRGESLLPLPSVCVSEWLKSCQITSSTPVLMIKCCAASQVGSTFILSRTVLLLTVFFYTKEVSAFCSELTAVCCNVASRLQNGGLWTWCRSLLVQRHTPLITGAKKHRLPVAAACGMHHPYVYSGCRGTPMRCHEGRRVVTAHSAGAAKETQMCKYSVRRNVLRPGPPGEFSSETPGPTRIQRGSSKLLRPWLCPQKWQL